MEPQATVSDLGKRLKRLRETELRMSTRELAAALDEIGLPASNASVTRYEGGREPPLSFILGLSILLDSTLDYVVDADAPKARDPSLPEAAYRQIAAIVLRVEGHTPTSGSGDRVGPDD